jgi:integrase
LLIFKHLRYLKTSKTRVFALNFALNLKSLKLLPCPMAYLFKNPGSPYWYAGFDFIGEDGRQHRVQRSTKIAHSPQGEVRESRKRAEKLAAQFEEAANKGTKGRLTIAAARSVMSEITEQFTGTKLETATVREHFASWLANKKPGLAKQSVVRYELVTRDFLACLGQRADIPLEYLQESDVIAFRDKESRASKSSRTVNLSVKIIRSALETARKRGLITHNPAAGVDTVTGEAIQREPFTAAEIEKLLAAAPDVEWRGLIMLGLYTGGRIGDLAHLKWGNVNLITGMITFQPEKTKKRGKKVSLPLHPALASFLLSLPSADDDSAPLFPKMNAKKVGGEHGLSRLFSRIMAAAGVDAMTVQTGFHAKSGDSKKKGKARSLARRSFHSLRHTAVSMMANAGVSEELRRKVTLHSDSEVHARYTHHEAGPLRAALGTLPDVSGK